MAEARIASIDIGDIADVAADVLTGLGHEGKTYPITGGRAVECSGWATRRIAVTLDLYSDVVPTLQREAAWQWGAPSCNEQNAREQLSHRPECRRWVDPRVLN
jgi:hypothetical protein